MSAVWLYPFILFAGVLQAAGNSMNGQLNKSMSNPWLAATISFALIVFVFATLFAIIPRPLPTAQGVASMPWWAPLGGITGAVAVFAGLMFVNKIGAGPFNGLMITANILFSLLIDHFGLLNMPVHALNGWRLLGGALMVGGIGLIAVF